MVGETDRPGAAAKPKCPICGRPAEPGLRPFCSRRCRDQDLLHWLSGRYAVPAVETEEGGAENDQEG